MSSIREAAILVPVPGPDHEVERDTLAMCARSLTNALTGTGLRSVLFRVDGRPLDAAHFQAFTKRLNEALDGSGVRVLTLQRRDGDAPPPEVLARVVDVMLEELRKAVPEYEWDAKARG